MSKKDREHYLELQKLTLSQLHAAKENYIVANTELDKLEHNQIVQDYLRAKMEWTRAMKDVSALERQLATWVYCLSQIPE